MYKLLIVDDEALERQVIKFLIEKFALPFECYEAENGAAAKELLSELKIDVVVTDVKMPFVNGIDLAKQIRQTMPEIQIIFFSGYDDFSYIKSALLLNVVNYILKPIINFF